MTSLSSALIKYLIEDLEKVLLQTAEKMVPLSGYAKVEKRKRRLKTFQIIICELSKLQVGIPAEFTKK